MDEINELEDVLLLFKMAAEEARKDPERYTAWIRGEIEIVIALINKLDKRYILGALGARLIKASPNLHNQFVAMYNGPDKEDIADEKMLEDEHAEVLLEYLMSICLSSANTSSDIIPTQKQINEIYEQLIKLKQNFNFLEVSKNIPVDGNGSDEWIRNSVVQDTMNMRGNGYHQHIMEVYKELFAPQDEFLAQFYGFNSDDLLEAIIKLDDLVLSKIGTLFGSMKSHDRFLRWSDQKGGEKGIIELITEKRKSPFEIFADEYPDVTPVEGGMGLIHYPLEYIEGYAKVFWVIPENEKERKIFNELSCSFGSNASFLFPPQYKAFIMNDTIIKNKPLIKEHDKFYHFSIQLAFRNIFRITENLIKSASEVYYENNYKGNSSYHSRDNYLERKTKLLFERMLPNTVFYSSLDYEVIENDVPKKTELDLIGISDHSIYIIEVKAGELNDKHKRGALKGLKDRIEDTIDYGSYQCNRAKKYIMEKEKVSFEYIEAGSRKVLEIENAAQKEIFKITVTLEHFAAVSINLRYLIEAGILNEDYKWSWIVSLYDLMIFSDLIENENDFNEYLINRLKIYEMRNVEFIDEIDILGYYLEGNFPIQETEEKHVIYSKFSQEIDSYYIKTGVGMPDIAKPRKK
ncbi:hypothetical protein [Flavobacterium collinsii]|uniref:NERD domain-containing protein n=1 Tax=Flavobacterium collinsii TaxID=1114861 RepID=A0A9W4TIZ6_9FLAO|nr:hypothetical protein [Flavobacterium collinsii]CAI2769134.1 conserved protein of unknown function [Flavobacterium collinsii]